MVIHINTAYCEFLYPDLIWEHSSVHHARNIAGSLTDNTTRPVKTQPERSTLIFNTPLQKFFRVADPNLEGRVSILFKF
jgi:hypothetical protein